VEERDLKRRKNPKRTEENQKKRRKKNPQKKLKKESKEEKPREKPTEREEREKERERVFLIGNVKSPRDAAVLSIPIFILNIVAIILLPLYLPPSIVDDTRALIHAYRSIRRIYVPEGIRLKEPLPLNIHVVRPRDSLVSLISRSFKIPVNSAKALVIAIEHGGVLKTTNRKTYEIALKLGMDAEFVE